MYGRNVSISFGAAQVGVAVIWVGVARWCCYCSEDRDPNDIEDLENMLEWHAMQVRVYICLSVCPCVITVLQGWRYAV